MIITSYCRIGRLAFLVLRPQMGDKTTPLPFFGHFGPLGGWFYRPIGLVLSPLCWGIHPNLWGVAVYVKIWIQAKTV